MGQVVGANQEIWAPVIAFLACKAFMHCAGREDDEAGSDAVKTLERYGTYLDMAIAVRGTTIKATIASKSADGEARDTWVCILHDAKVSEPCALLVI